MKLTAIKIRGKGPKKKGFRPPQRGRRVLSDGSAEPPPSKRRRRRPPALIEQLPLEIIERIFLFSENLALPRASLRIGYFLSARSFLLELVISAFSPTWDVWFGIARGPAGSLQSYHGHATDHGRVGGDPRLQTEVLACPWATLPVLLHAMQVWRLRRGGGRHYEHITLECQPWPADPSPAACPPPPPPATPHHHPRAGPHHLHDDLRACFEADWAAFSAPHACRRVAFATTHLAVHPAARVPEAVVAGPVFGAETVRRLFWLRACGAAAPDDWEVTRQALDAALALPDDALALLVARLLDSWDVFGAGWPPHVQDEVLALLAARLRSPNNALPMTSAFVHAVLEESVAKRETS